MSLTHRLLDWFQRVTEISGMCCLIQDAAQLCFEYWLPTLSSKCQVDLSKINLGSSMLFGCWKEVLRWLHQGEWVSQEKHLWEVSGLRQYATASSRWVPKYLSFKCAGLFERDYSLGGWIYKLPVAVKWWLRTVYFSEGDNLFPEIYFNIIVPFLS